MLMRSKNKSGIPPYFKERCVVRATDVEFGPSKKGNPMITVSWELCGIPNKTGTCDLEFKRGEGENEIIYDIGGLTVNPSYFALVPTAINMYAEFWEKANGSDFEGVDESNPDIDFIREQLCMEAIVTGKQVEERKTLSPDEKEELIAAGKPAIGEPILDANDQPIVRNILSIGMFLSKFTGEPPLPF